MKAKKEAAMKPYMVRLKNVHREIIKKGTKRLGFESEAEFVRKAIEAYAH